MLKSLFLSILAGALVLPLAAQEKWDLQKCVDYALSNNISVKQTEIQTGFAEIQLKQSRQSQYPTVNFSTGPAFSNGRNQDPTNFSLITQSFVSANMQMQTSAQIFNWYSRKNTILANEWQVQANKASTEKLKNDIALTVANNYLQVLLAGEQEKIAAVQLEQSLAQWSNTRKLVDAGALPELNATELEAQAARDSSNLIAAKGNYNLALLALKSVMNLDAAYALALDTPPVEKIPIEKIADLQPEAVYALAVVNLPQQRVNDFNLKAAQKNAEAARAGMYPTISAFGNLSSAFNNKAQEITGTVFSYPPVGRVDVAGINYDVYPLAPISNYTFGKSGLFRQLDQNFRQTIGISMNIPVFNGGALRASWERSKLNIKSVELQQQADNLKIKQDIYQAYNAALTALERFNAGKKSVDASGRAYDFAQKRYGVGMLGTLELITAQNNLFRAKLEYVLNQFDYVFKMKVLEFYRGQGLKL
jgi:outer membrane protein